MNIIICFSELLALSCCCCCCFVMQNYVVCTLTNKFTNMTPCGGTYILFPEIPLQNPQILLHLQLSETRK